jgi:hypothetical protein
MAEKEKKSSWEVPSPGPGTMSGFFVAWLFVGAIIGLTIILMLIGKGSMPLRVAGYDLGLEGKSVEEVDLDKLVLAVRQTNAMVLALHGSSEELTKALSRQLELKYVGWEGSSAILSRYEMKKSERAGWAVLRYGKKGRFGVMSLDLRKGGGAEPARLREAAEVAEKEFGGNPHAILVLGSGEAPSAPFGYVEASAENKEASDWHVFVPERLEDKVDECYVPVDNVKIREFSQRLPIVARFVFRKEDFE